MTRPAGPRPFELPEAEVLAHAIHTLAVGMAEKQRCSVQHAANLVLIAANVHSPPRRAS